MVSFDDSGSIKWRRRQRTNASGEQLVLIRTATVGDGGWVDRAEPIIVQAGEGLIVAPVEDHS